MKLKVCAINMSCALLVAVAAFGCTKKPASNPDDTGFLFDPRLPGGVINPAGGSIRGLDSVQADASTVGTIILTWKVPSLFSTLDYKVKIYRMQCKSSETTCVLPDPTNQYSNSELFKIAEVKAQVYIDQNPTNGDPVNIQDGADYTYWLYLTVGGQWSSASKLGVTAATAAGSLFIAPPDQFWAYKRWEIGSAPPVDGGNPQDSLYTIQAGKSTALNPKGTIAFAKGGAIMYYADTDNNRIVIYEKQNTLSCQTITDPLTYAACVYQFSAEPFVAANVIGQPNQYTTYKCGDAGALPNNECLTKPTRVYVDNDQRIIIADSGNNRIVVWDHIPILSGCDTNVNPLQTTVRDCTPSFVIGQKSLTDIQTYSVSTDGIAALTNPQDVLVVGYDMYIADTGNHRVVKVKRYADQNQFQCSPATWKTSTCQFSAVLGQQTFTENKTFKEMYEANPSMIDHATGLGDSLTSDYSSLLKRYFANPARLALTGDGKLLVASYEDFQGSGAIYQSTLGPTSPLMLLGRILVFNSNPIGADTPLCNSATFATGNCDASDVFGQTYFDKIPVISSVGGSYFSSVSYGLEYVSDFQVIDEQILAVDPVNNAIYMWADWTTNTAAGKPYDAKVLNPNGAPNPNNNGLALPTLKSISSISYQPGLGNIYVSDSDGSKVYEIKASTY